MKPILEIQDISKQFFIDHEKMPYYSFRDRLGSLFKAKPKQEEFWALRDVTFNVMPGESIGVIGRNGAGKSTLLKILSKITPPTKGKIIARGRIASLLEVGTGFHQELTGRENIFMNGSILGMKKIEIKERFDEIVDFSGVEKFLDTPLKHYSSGMQLRLAFAVAAHLEPEILIIDEVLAVGDSTFQKKCMDKMADIVNQGRTVLFVSHNMPAIKSLCSRALILREGKVYNDGDVDTVVNQYLLEENILIQKEYSLSEIKRTTGLRGLVFSKLKLNKGVFKPGEEIKVQVELQGDNNHYRDLLFGINIYDTIGNCIVHLSNIFLNKININHHNGDNYLFVINELNLRPGIYSISLFLKANEEVQDWLTGVALIEIQDGNVYEFYNSQMIQGLFQPRFSFEQTYGKEY